MLLRGHRERSWPVLPWPRLLLKGFTLLNPSRAVARAVALARRHGPGCRYPMAPAHSLTLQQCRLMNSWPCHRPRRALAPAWR